MGACECFGSHGMYYLDHETQRRNLQQQLSAGQLPFGTTVTPARQGDEPGTSRIGIREDDVGAGPRVKRYHPSDVVAQTEFEMTGGAQGLTAYKEHRETDVTAFDSSAEPAKTSALSSTNLEKEGSVSSLSDTSSGDKVPQTEIKESEEKPSVGEKAESSSEADNESTKSEKSASEDEDPSGSTQSTTKVKESMPSQESKKDDEKTSPEKSVEVTKEIRGISIGDPSSSSSDDEASGPIYLE